MTKPSMSLGGAFAAKAEASEGGDQSLPYRWFIVVLAIVTVCGPCSEAETSGGGGSLWWGDSRMARGLQWHASSMNGV